MQVRLRGHARSAIFATKAQARQWATQVESGILRQHTLAAGVQVTLGGQTSPKFYLHQCGNKLTVFPHMRTIEK